MYDLTKFLSLKNVNKHLISKLQLIDLYRAGYYKGVDASNVKTKKVLNENCHFWANFNKNFTNDTTN